MSSVMPPPSPSVVLAADAPPNEGSQTPIASERQPVYTQLYEMTDDEKIELLNDIRLKFSDARDFMSTLYPRMKRNYKKYRSIAEPLVDKLGRQIKGRANLYIPYPWAIVESEMPRMAGRLPRIRAFPRKPSETAKVEKIQDNLYYTFDRMDFIQKQILWLRQYAIYGWSPLFVFWREESRTVFDRVYDKELRTWTLNKVEKKVWDDFGCQVLDVWDSFMQPGVEDPTGGDWFEFRDWLSRDDIEARVEAGLFYPDTIDVLDKGGLTTNSQADDGRADRDQLAGFTKSLSKNAYGKHEVLYHLEDTRITVMIDRCVIARCGDNPHPLQEKPVINANLMPQISEPLGISTIDQLAGLPEKLNALSNSRLDNIAQIVQRLWLAKRFSQTDFNNLKSSAGNIILTDDMNSVKMLDTQDLGQSSGQEVMTTKEEMQFVSGVSDFIVGVRSSARLSDTATGVSTIVREANARFALKLATFESGSLRKLVTWAHAYNMTYQPVSKMIYVHGPEGWIMSTVTIDEILVEAEFAVEPGSSAPLDQLSRRGFLLDLLDRVMRAPQIIDQRKYWREVLEAGDIRNAEDLLITKNDPIPYADDIELIRAENIALQQAQPIELLGDDRIHLAGHAVIAQGKSFASLPQAAQDAIVNHIQAHTERLTEKTALAARAGSNALFGGNNGGPAPGAPGGVSQPTAGGAGVSAPGTPIVPTLERPAGVPVSPQAGLA